MPFETIKNRSDFLAASRGRKYVASAFILQMLPRADTQPARFGFTVTKKMGNAVTRNRIKRRLRAGIREIAATRALPGHDYVMISRHAALDCSFSDLLRDMEFAFSRISSMKKHTSSSAL